MVKILFFMSILLCFSAFANSADGAYQNESKICREYNKYDPFMGLCKVSKDKGRILVLAPKVTFCKYKTDRDLIWVLTELSAKDGNEIRSTKICNLNMGGWNPPTFWKYVYNFGEMENGKIWMAYRAQSSKYKNDDSDPGDPFKIVSFIPNGGQILESDLSLIHKLIAYSTDHPTPFSVNKFNPYSLTNPTPYTHKPNFTYLETTKEFLFYSLNASKEGCFLDMNYKKRFCLPTSPGRYASTVQFSTLGDRVVYNFYEASGVVNYDSRRYNRSFGVFDLSTGKSIYEYSGNKINYADARFIDGTDQYVHFYGMSSQATGFVRQAFVIDISSGNVVPVPYPGDFRDLTD